MRDNGQNRNVTILVSKKCLFFKRNNDINTSLKDSFQIQLIYYTCNCRRKSCVLNKSEKNE